MKSRFAMVEMLEGAIRFNVWYLAFNALLLSIFLTSWYKFYKKTGMNLDIWIYTMFLTFVIPFIVMYPFVTSDFNILYVGNSGIDVINSGIDEAYIVSALGFCSIFLGKFCYDRYGINKYINFIFYKPFINSIGLYYKSIALSRNVSRGASIVYIFILTVFVTFTVSQGFVNNPRAFFMVNTQFRPFYNLVISLFSIIFGILSTRVLQYNLLKDKILLAPIILFGFFLGVRAPIIFQCLGLGVIYVIYNRKGYIQLYKMLFFVLFILVLIIILVVIRNNTSDTGRDSLSPFITFVYEIFYGNTFSDIRDFSWVIGYWNRSYFWGMSYLSAFLSFIPSALLPFREKWGIGKLTVNMLGFDPTIHPGLRPGFFGEIYLNFGVLGVVLLGFIWSQVMQKVNDIIRSTINSHDVVSGNSALIATSFLSYLSNTAGFFGFYVLFISLFVLYIFTKIKL